MFYDWKWKIQRKSKGNVDSLFLLVLEEISLEKLLDIPFSVFQYCLLSFFLYLEENSILKCTVVNCAFPFRNEVCKFHSRTQRITRNSKSGRSGKYLWNQYVMESVLQSEFRATSFIIASSWSKNFPFIALERITSELRWKTPIPYLSYLWIAIECIFSQMKIFNLAFVWGDYDPIVHIHNCFILWYHHILVFLLSLLKRFLTGTAKTPIKTRLRKPRMYFSKRGNIFDSSSNSCEQVRIVMLKCFQYE